jgi:hypothetical protein
MSKCEWCGKVGKEKGYSKSIYKCEICGREYCLRCTKEAREFNYDKGEYTTLIYCVDCSNIWAEFYPISKKLQQKHERELEELKVKYYEMALEKSGKLDKMYVID